MACEADIAHFAIAPGLLDHLHHAPRPEREVDVFHVHDVMHLIQIEVVRLQTRQTLKQIELGVSVRTVPGLGAENDPVPRHTFQSDAVPTLAETVRPRCGGVEVVDPRLVGVADCA